MGIADLFRPKWKHSDAEVRATAVQKLGPEEMEALVAIASNDDDPAVRRIAIKKIDDPEILAKLAQNDPERTLQRMAADKANGILTAKAVADDAEEAEEALDRLTEQKALTTVARSASLEPIRQAALDRLTDARAIAEVARSAGNNNTRLAAVRLIDDPAILRSIALSDDRKEICVAALEKITDPEALAFISKKARIKSVRTQARRRIKTNTGKADNKPKAEQVAQKKRHARQVQLCGLIETISRSKDIKKAIKQMARAEVDWQELGTDADDDLIKRYDKAIDLYNARSAQYDVHVEKQTGELEKLQANMDTKIKICEMLEGLGKEISEARLAAAKQEWDQVGPVPENQRSALADRFARACSAVVERSDTEQEEQSLAMLREGLETLCIQAEALPEMRQAGQAARLYEGIKEEWQELAEAAGGDEPDEALTARFKAVAAKLDTRATEEVQRKKQQNEEKLEQLAGLCARLDELTTSEDQRAIERKLREVGNALRKASDLPRERVDELKNGFRDTRDKLRLRLEELREQEEWKRWANITRLEELCKEVEALLKVENHKEKAKHLRSAQAKWKRVGPAPKAKSEELWKRFKGACDEVYASCQEYFTQEDDQRSENLKQKEALCEKVEALADSTDWVETAEAIKTLQRDWKKIGPAPRAQSDEVWKRFRKACDVFFDNRQDHLDEVDSKRTGNLQQKEELCDKAEALMESTDWVETADAIKGLQRQWKDIGPVPRAKSDSVWRRFRKACDAFFDRREEQQDKARNENLEQKEELSKEMVALADAWDHREQSDASEVVTAVMDVRARWKQIGAGPPHKEDAVWAVVAETLERIVTAIPEEFEGTDLAPSVSQKKKEELCQRVEAMAGPEISTTDSAEQIAEQLRSALAANALKDSASDDPTVPSSPVDEVKRIQAEWNRTGPVPRPAGQDLWDRFTQACEKVLAAHPEEKPKREPRDRDERKRPPRDRGDLEQNLARKVEICEQAEALAADEDCGSHRSKIKKLQRTWKAVGPMPDAQAKELWNRFRGACNTVLSESGKAARAKKELEAREKAEEPVKAEEPAPEPAEEPAKAEESAPAKAEEPEVVEPEPAPEPAKAAEAVEVAEPAKAEEDDLDMDDLDSLWDDVLEEADTE